MVRAELLLLFLMVEVEILLMINLLFWKITVMGLRGLDYKRKWMVQRSFHSQFIMYLKILKIYVSELILIKRL